MGGIDTNIHYSNIARYTKRRKLLRSNFFGRKFQVTGSHVLTNNSCLFNLPCLQRTCIMLDNIFCEIHKRHYRQTYLLPKRRVIWFGNKIYTIDWRFKMFRNYKCLVWANPDIQIGQGHVNYSYSNGVYMMISGFMTNAYTVASKPLDVMLLHYYHHVISWQQISHVELVTTISTNYCIISHQFVIKYCSLHYINISRL